MAFSRPPTVMYHGTSVRSWERHIPEGTLFLTSNSEEALYFALETARHDEHEGRKPEPIVLEIKFSDLRAGSVTLEPDWLAYNETEESPDNPTWEDTLSKFGTFAISGNVEELKEKFRVVERPDFRKMGSRIWVTIPVLVLRPPYTKVAISLPELIRQTNAFSVKRRAGCNPTLKKSRPKDLYLEYKVVCHENYSDPAGHDVQVQFDLSQVEKTQDAKRLDVRCSCSCPAFLYWGAQWTLHQRDGLQGQPRPLLQAPTQRLDLRNNFVICKHVKAVFERILPAVQHNIVNIVREREVRQQRERMEQKPPTEKGKRLKERQEELWRKKQIEKIVRTKDEEKQKAMIDELVEREGKRLQEEEAPPVPPAPAPAPPPATPAPAPAPPAAGPEEAKVIKRDEPATARPPAPPPAPAAPAQPSLRDLVRREERKLQKGKKPGYRYVCPYDGFRTNLPWKFKEHQEAHAPRKASSRAPAGVGARERLKNRRTSLEASLVGIVGASSSGKDAMGTPQEVADLMERRSFQEEARHDDYAIYSRHDGKISLTVRFEGGKVRDSTLTLMSGERGEDRKESATTEEGFEGVWHAAQAYGD